MSVPQKRAFFYDTASFRLTSLTNALCTTVVVLISLEKSGFFFYHLNFIIVPDSIYKTDFVLNCCFSEQLLVLSLKALKLHVWN